MRAAGVLNEKFKTPVFHFIEKFSILRKGQKNCLHLGRHKKKTTVVLKGLKTFYAKLAKNIVFI